METIKKTASRVGLSEAALRKYEKHGILKPVVSAESGYRYYDYVDISRLLSCKKLRQCGFSLEQTAMLINTPTIAYFENKLKQKEAELAEQFLCQQRMLESMKIMRQEIAGIADELGKYRVEERPGTYYFFQSLDTDVTPEVRDRIKMWTDLMPIVRLVIQTHYDAENFVCRHGAYGFGINEADIHLLKSEPGPGLMHIEPCKCVTSIIECRGDNKFLLEEIPVLARYAQGLGFSICEDIILDSLVLLGKGKAAHAYRKVYVLIKE